MNSKGKYIGLNQRIPFDVLDAAIHFYLMNGVIDRKYILQRMQEFTSGINRATKATMYVVKILTREEKILNYFKKALKSLPYNSLKLADRKAFCLCLIGLTYPITYDLLVALGQGFKVQDQVNKKFINEKVMSLYGSNRTVEVAIDALMPILIEYNNIKRDKISLYSFGTRLVVSNKFISELLVYTDIKLSGSKSILVDDLNYKSWFTYFDLTTIKPNEFSLLVVKKDSAVGGGYLSI